MSDTPQRPDRRSSEAPGPTGSKSNPRAPGSAPSPPTRRRSKTAATTGSAPGTTLPSTVVLKATPQPHSKVDGWTGCDDVNPGGDECSVEVTAANRKVSANFTRLQRTVTAATGGTGTGFVSDANGLGAIQSCGDGRHLLGSL